MKVIIKRPGEKAEAVEIENELKALQNAVGGHIEHVGFGWGIGILCDEEGRFKGPLVDGRPTSLPFNFFLNPYGSIVGPALFVAEKGDEFVGLNDEQIALVWEFLNALTDEKGGRP